MGRITQNLKVSKVSIAADGTFHTDDRADTVIVEEPLEIRVDGQVITTTMRTPGDDIELAHGFLFGEGLISAPTEVATARYCAGAVGPQGHNTYNVLEIAREANQPPVNAGLIRLTTTTPACGVSGSSPIDSILKKSRYPVTPVSLDPQLVVRLPELLRSGQRRFRRTGGVHAAGIFTTDGEAEVIRQDIGRHNAADKVIGHALLQGSIPATERILVMSSRASFELVNKAVMAGFSALVAVSAPSSLAIDLAREAGLTLIAFTREDRFNLYSGQLAGV